MSPETGLLRHLGAQTSGPQAQVPRPPPQGPSSLLAQAPAVITAACLGSGPWHVKQAQAGNRRNKPRLWNGVGWGQTIRQTADNNMQRVPPPGKIRKQKQKTEFQLAPFYRD